MTTNPIGNPDFDLPLNLSEAAAYLRVSRSTVMRLLRDGAIAASKAGREWRITRQALDDFCRRGYGTGKKRSAAAGGKKVVEA